MGQCKLCGKKGVFLSLSRNGLCDRCEESFVLDLKNRLRIIDDCLRLITTSKNIDTRLKRCDLLEEQAKDLLEYQKKRITIPGGINPSDFISTVKQMRGGITKEKVDVEIDWKKSKAHLLLLSKFIHANSLEDFAKHDYWKNWWDSLLGEPSQKAIKRFVDESMLMTPELNELLSYKYKIPELKALLKQRGLSASGRKEEMIQRLTQADPDGLKKTVAELSLLICTQRGHEIAEQYIEAKKEKHAQVERQVMEYLVSRKFKEAILTVDAYEAEHEFPNEMAIKYTTEQEIERLKTIFESKPPKIIGKLGNEKLESLRIAAAMMNLCGIHETKKWLLETLETGLPYDSETVVRMFVFYVRHKGDLERYRSTGLKYVEVLPTPDSCESCKKLAGKHYKIDEAPELPNPDCSHKMGCRCKYLPVV